MLTAQKKILVVDDDDDIREVMTLILESEGFHVSSLNNGSSVLETVHQQRPDVVVLDVQLGDADGRDICKEIKNQAVIKDTPIIIVSATHGWHTMHEKHCQADDYLAKPFDISDLVEHVKRYAA